VAPSEPVAAPAPEQLPEEGLLGEPRWPPLTALALLIALNISLRLWLPDEPLVSVPWLIPVLEVVLFTVLLVAHPARQQARRAKAARRVAITLVCVLVAGALGATALLIHDLITGAKVAQSPSTLLADGAFVWVGNNLAFALLFWLMDGGGPLARLRHPTPVDFAFTQQLSPEIAPPGWRPFFLDYLHLGFTNATAFSPTDVMPLTHRAKYTMLVQSTVAIALFGLVVARAVNAFT
jgi:uncharacterized membrane protein